MLEGAVEYAVDYGKGEVEKFDKEHMIKVLKEVTKDDDLIVNELEGNTNFLMFVASSEIF